MNKQRVAYTPIGGVCSKMIIVEAEDNVISNVQIVGGCQGNTQGLSRLLKYKTLSNGLKVSTAANGEHPARISWPRH